MHGKLDYMERADREAGPKDRKNGGKTEVGDGSSAGQTPRALPLAAVLRPVQTSAAKQLKERNIVTWSQEEDDLLREQVGNHGTENWTSIAAQFKDKTARQCRRRWFTYLNVECKKGGWSPEEDMILCEAQKIFGNRWTEISKVVSGRTDNAVKNRFTTLCKKRAKRESMTKENKCPHTYSDREGRPNANDSSTYFLSEPSSTLKKIRYQKATQKQIHGVNQRPTCDDTLLDIQHRKPFAVLADNYGNVGGLPEHQLGVYNLETVRNDGKSANEESHGSFLRRDDPKISALLRQEELLRSLARKVYTDDTDQCLENAWKELKEYLIQNGERGLANNEVAQIDFLLDDLKDLVAELGSSNTGSCPTSRETDIHEHSSHWSDHVSCPNRHTPDEENILQTEEFCLQLHNVNRSHLTDVRKLNEEYDDQGIKLPGDILSSISMALFSPCGKRVNDESPLVLENVEYSSPLQTVPVFCPFEEGIPSPNFSASERRLLLSILGFSSPSANCNNPSQQPSCKRALLHSL